MVRPEEHGPWFDETLLAIAEGFQIFSLELRARVEKEHPSVQMAQNAMIAGYLRRYVEYLQGTTSELPEALRESFRRIEEVTFDKVVVASGLSSVTEFRWEDPPS